MPKIGVTCSKGGYGLESLHTLHWAQEGSRGRRMLPNNGEGWPEHSGRGTVDGFAEELNVPEDDLPARAMAEECMPPSAYLTRRAGW